MLPGLSGRLPKIAEKIGVLKPLTGPHGEQGTISWVNNIMLYKQGKHPAETKEFLKWWSEHEKELWTKGHVTQLPVRKSFTDGSLFSGQRGNQIHPGQTTCRLERAQQRTLPRSFRSSMMWKAKA